VNAWITQEVQQTRLAIATELCPSETTLTEDVTVVATLPCGYRLATWRHMLLSDCEHPGIVATAQEIGRRFGEKCQPAHNGNLE